MMDERERLAALLHENDIGCVFALYPLNDRKVCAAGGHAWQAARLIAAGVRLDGDDREESRLRTALEKLWNEAQMPASWEREAGHRAGIAYAVRTIRAALAEAPTPSDARHESALDRAFTRLRENMATPSDARERPVSLDVERLDRAIRAAGYVLHHRDSRRRDLVLIAVAAERIAAEYGRAATTPEPDR
jgi:hypothetical protein